MIEHHGGRMGVRMVVRQVRQVHQMVREVVVRLRQVVRLRGWRRVMRVASRVRGGAGVGVWERGVDVGATAHASGASGAAYHHHR